MEARVETMPVNTLLTVEQFLELPWEERRQYELWEGELVLVATPKPNHNFVSGRAYRLVDTFLDSNPLGYVVYETEFRFANSVRRPDVAFIRMKRWKPEYGEADAIPLVPDLVIEVVSMSEKSEDLHAKVNSYLEAGAEEVWVLYRRVWELQIWRAGNVQRLRVGDIIESPSLLPGFAVPVAEFFRRLKEATSEQK